MPRIRFLPDDRWVDAGPGETVLAAALRAGVPHVHACRGNAHCSTCRIEIRDGLGDCLPRTAAERVLSDRLGFSATLRLACQTVPQSDLVVRRLVLDDDDAALVDQRRRDQDYAAGEERELAILFADIRGFTSFAEPLPPHDVVHVLNRYFHVVGAPILRCGGRIDNYMGDGVMALFGLDTSSAVDPVHRAVEAGLAMIAATDGLKPYLASAYGRTFDIGVGINVGDVVVGSIGAIGRERITAIGDAVNFASRIESANKGLGTRLLVSEAVRATVGARLVIPRSFRIPIAGKQGEFDLHEVSALTGDAAD
jgi:adenylate cyclase